MYAQKEIQQSVQWIQQNSIIVKELNIQLKIEYTFFAENKNLIREQSITGEAEREQKEI